MTTFRTYEEDVSYWLELGSSGEETDATYDPFLRHLSNIEILGLGDSYDDGKIDTLTTAYIKLRELLTAEGIGLDPNDQAD